MTAWSWDSLSWKSPTQMTTRLRAISVRAPGLSRLSSHESVNIYPRTPFLSRITLRSRSPDEQNSSDLCTGESRRSSRPKVMEKHRPAFLLDQEPTTISPAVVLEIT
jgi:hypothetical protein